VIRSSNLLGKAGYPSILFSSIILVGCQMYIIRLYGLISIPSMFTALFTYPALIPFLGDYLFQTKNYTLRAIPYENEAHVQKVLFFLVIFISAFVVTLGVLKTELNSNQTDTDPVGLQKNIPAFTVVAIVNLFAAYLTTPGPTILTADYVTVLNAWFPWAAFAGALYLGTWAMLYLMSRGEAMDSWYYRMLLVVSLVGVLWLLLHARRNETMGVLTMLLIDYFARRSRSEKKLPGFFLKGVLLTAVVLSGFLAGKLRGSGGVFEGSIRELFIATGAPGTYVAPPGSPHNIFGTTLAVVDIFGKETPNLFGMTFLYYLPQGIPSGVYAIFGLPFPTLMHDVIGRHYEAYNGGNYIANPYYANFGEAGLLFGAIVLGFLVYFAHRQIINKSNTTFLTGVAVILVVAGFRASWYTQLNWIDNLEGFLVGYLIYVVSINLVEKRNSIPIIQNITNGQKS